ncbi:MAG: GNAT family N-acetyltransferase, partial [Alphaproteobacteria bacterium HGW-Alphaproteobacteria-7]
MAGFRCETERLILRTIEDADAALQFRLLNTPAIMERLGGVKELHEIEAKHARSQGVAHAQG